MVAGVLLDDLVLTVEDGVKHWHVYLVERGKDWSTQTLAELLNKRVVAIAGVL
jgi:hypothetical protein